MTEILCKWLNNDVALSKRIDPNNFAEEFSNGFFFGEILSKHGLQDDFSQFSTSKQSAAKINNFMRLEPTINLLEIPFNTNIARDIMQEKKSTATQLLYQIYIALTNKQKRNLTGMAMETMRPQGPVKLEQFESKIYQNQLKAKTPRQTDLNLEMLRQKYEKFKIEQAELAFDQKFEDEERQKQELQDKRQYLLDRSKKFRLQQAEIAARIQKYENEDLKAATVQIPKTPPKFKKEAMLERRRQFERNEAEKALNEITAFEKRFKGNNREVENDLNIVDIEETRSFDDSNDVQQKLDPVDFLKPKSNDDYINKIRNRLQEDAHARKEREKRRRKVLVDQLRANEALEEAKREETLVAHMLRQTQFERRIAVELLHARHEKDIIRENCIVKQREIEQNREKEFYEALEREKELARLARLEYLDQVKKDKELHDLIAADRAAAKYKDNYEICKGIINQIVDLSCKAGEYLVLNDKLIPPKLWRDWIKLYEAGLPLYEEDLLKVEEEKENEKPPNEIDEEATKLLDDCDFNEYRSMIGEWEIQDDGLVVPAPTDNKIVGFVVNRLHNLCYPVAPGAPAPLFPKFPLKAIVVGKPFSGKTSSLKMLEQDTGLKIINPQRLINAAIEAYKKNPNLNEDENTEKTTTSEAVAPVVPQPVALPPPPPPTQPEKSKSDLRKKKKADKEKVPELVVESEVDFKDDNIMVRRLGEIAMNSLNNGEPIKDEIVVHIIVEKIRELPQDKGWVIDGFPLTYNQAKLLEKALTGYDDENPFPKKPKADAILAANPRPEPPPPKHKSAIDIVIHLETSNETILKRSAGRFTAKLSNTFYHQQFKEPPEGSYTGLNQVEVVEPAKDPANDMEQLQHRITTFEDNWGKVFKFYEKFSRVAQITTGNLNEATVAIEIHRCLDDFVEERERKKREEIERKIAEENMKNKLEKEKENELARKKHEEEAAALEMAKAKEVEKAAQEARERSQSPPKSAKGKRGAKSPKSPKGGDKSDKSDKADTSKSKGKTPSPKGKRTKSESGPPVAEAPAEPIPEPPKTTERQIPVPGSEDWVYVEEKINSKIAKSLSDQWDVVENTYIDGTKYVFRKMRVDREQLIRYFYEIKEDFKEYLKRPDTKQEYIDAFIKMYNNDVPDDIRDDEEVKSELHQRVEDLKENLWKICDKKKEDSERELEAIKNDKWLPDKIGILNNQYITLMQIELDRFFDTARMLKDYYKCMQSPVPEEVPAEYPRLPLLDLKNPEDETQEGSTTQLQSTLELHETTLEKTIDQTAEKPKSPKSPKSPRQLSANKKKEAAAAAAVAKKGKKTPNDSSENSQADGERKKRIPLVPRRPSSATDANNKKAAAKGKPKNPEEMSPPPPEDIDEKHIFESHKQSIVFVNTFIGGELAAFGDTEVKAAPVAEDKSKQKTPKLGKVVVSKSRSPSAKGKDKKGAAKVEEPPAPENFKDSFLVHNENNYKNHETSYLHDLSLSQISERDFRELSSARSSFFNIKPVEEDRGKKSLKDKMKEEYIAALKHEEAAFKTRIDAIKAIAMKIIQGLKEKADNSYKSMNDWLGSRWMKEMDSIKNLVEIIKNFIENKEKIKEQLVLKQEDFFIDSDIVVLRAPTPIKRPPPVEYITPEQFSIESLHIILAQFKLVAPEGLVAIKTFIDIYTDLATLDYGTEILPENWSNLSQQQIEALAKMLANGSEFVNWRHWLLFASVPWPLPTQSELLSLLVAYKNSDKENIGYIDKTTFIKTPLWFTIERPPTPTDISQPKPYDRFANLLEFWFELFSEPYSDNLDTEELLIDYRNMLLYMSAVPEPYDGFLRALSISQESPMPKADAKIHMKIPTFNSPDYDLLKTKSHSEKLPSDQLVLINALHKVFHHGERQRGDTHRFASSEDPEDFMSMERLFNIYSELDEEKNKMLPYSKLIAHPVLCEMISNCTKFRAPDFRVVFNMQSSQEDDLNQDRRTPND